MTQPAVPPIDPGNRLLAEVPAELTTTVLPAPSGQRFALTIRTHSTTLTVLLSKEDAKSWRDNFTNTIDRMSGLVVASPGTIPPFKPNNQKG